MIFRTDLIGLILAYIGNLVLTIMLIVPSPYDTAITNGIFIIGFVFVTYIVLNLNIRK